MLERSSLWTFRVPSAAEEIPRRRRSPEAVDVKQGYVYRGTLMVRSEWVPDQLD